MPTINWLTYVIYVPQSELTPLGGSRYELDVETFRLALKDIEDNLDGMVMPDTHRRNAPVTLAGTEYAQTFEVLAPYTVEFEDGQYTVVVVGGNHNIADRKVANSVSLIIGNAAGLIKVDVGGGDGGGATPAELWGAALTTGGTGTMGERMRAVLTVAKFLGLT